MPLKSNREATLAIRLQQKDRDELERIAERDDESVSAVVGRFIRQGLKAAGSVR